MWESADFPVDPQFHPVTALGLPDYPAASLSDSDARIVYVHGERLMRQKHNTLIEKGATAEERARQMHGMRSGLRIWTRGLMSDLAAVRELQTYERNRTFEEFVGLHRKGGLTGDDVYEAIVVSSTKSRPSVNDELGIDPENPPPLPPVPPEVI
jgi:hypothetical protein